MRWLSLLLPLCGVGLKRRRTKCLSRVLGIDRQRRDEDHAAPVMLIREAL